MVTMALRTRVLHRLLLIRRFVDAKIKWVQDPFLDTAVEREKNFKGVISLKNQIVSSPSKSLPLFTLSPLKTHFNLPTSTTKLFQKYPSVFSQFQPSPSLPLHVKLTPQAMTLHKEELAIHCSPCHRNDTVNRLAKLLMLTKAGRLPLHIVDKFKFDLGLPSNYITFLLSDYPEYFHVCECKSPSDGKETLFLELVSWRDELAISEMEKRVSFSDEVRLKKGLPLRFSMKLPNGIDLEKKVKNWVEAWQDLPYISPYENAFHLGPNSDQAEKWTVAVLHELLWLLVSKKTEGKTVYSLGEYLGFENRFEKAVKHFPGIFYISNKIRTQTVVLKEAYRKDFLMEKHPLVGMRFRYIHLMNKSDKFRKGHGVRLFRTKIKNPTPEVAKYVPPVEKIIKTRKSAANAYGSTSSNRPYACPYEGCEKAYIHEYRLKHPGDMSDENDENATPNVDNEMDEGNDLDSYAGKQINGKGQTK